MYSFVAAFLLAILSSTGLSSANLEFLAFNKTGIYRIDEDKRQHLVILQSSISDMDYHPEKNLLFWIDSSKGVIVSHPLNSSLPRLILKPRGDYWNPRALAVDCANDKLYVADSRKIDLLEFDGRHRAIVLGAELFGPTDLKLDPEERFLFVLDSFRLLRANTDGSSVQVIAKSNIAKIIGISIDAFNNRVYYLDIQMKKVRAFDYSGKDVGSLVTNGTVLKYSEFSVLNDSVYFATDFIDYDKECWNDNVKGHYNPVPGIKMIQPVPQKSALVNPCKKDNGGCQHLCILMNYTETNNEYKCACNVGWRLDESSVNCTRVEEFIFFQQAKQLRAYDTKPCTSGFCDVFIPRDILRHEEFPSLDYYTGNGYIYYILKSHFNIDSIIKTRMNDSLRLDVPVGSVDDYQSLSVDWLSANLYFIDSSKETVRVVNLKNETQEKVLLTNLTSPKDIRTHPSRGVIYFLQSFNGTVLFSRANSDGSNLTVFNETKFSISKDHGYAIDYVEDRIYWYSKFEDYIQHSNLELEDVQIIKTRLTKHVVSMSVFKKWIYLVGLSSSGLWRFDKKTGEQEELILQDLGDRITDFKIFSSELQKMNDSHPCNLNSGDCSEFCFGLFESENNAWTKVCADSDKKNKLYFDRRKLNVD